MRADALPVVLSCVCLAPPAGEEQGVQQDAAPATPQSARHALTPGAAQGLGTHSGQTLRGPSGVKGYMMISANGGAV